MVGIEGVPVKPQVQQASGQPPGASRSGSGAHKAPENGLGCSRHTGLPAVGNPQGPEVLSDPFPSVKHGFSCALCPGLGHMCGGEWQHLFPRVPEPAAGPTQLLSLCTIGVPLAVFQVGPLLLTVLNLLVMAPNLAPTGMWEQHRSDSRGLSHSAWCTLSQSCENLP